MNNILDKIEQIKKLDSQNMLGSLQMLANQVVEVLNYSKNLKIPASYKQIDRILVVGMGGSALGSHVFKTLYKDELKVPVEINNDYHIPKFVNSKTLVIVSTYSGSTEETLNAVREALKSKAKIIGITSGGKLGDWLKKNKLPVLQFTTKSNPCGSPRMGLGYSIMGQLILLSKIGLIRLGKKDYQDIADTINRSELLFGVNNQKKYNPAKLIAIDLLDKEVFYIGAEHLSGNAHIMANQMNENAKRFSTYFLIPELNHHLLEGMIYPQNNKNNLVFLLVNSNLYDKKVQKRFDITVDVLNKNKIRNFTYICGEKTKLEQVLEVLILGSYISYYSAILQGIDPTAIPFVDYFKKQLAK